MRTEIIYEDKDILVICKPAGLAVQTARVGQADVVSELKNHLAGKRTGSYLGIIHRLDQPVEGLLVFARHQKAAASLSRQLLRQDGEESLNKQYLGVLWGRPDAKEGTLVGEMYKDASGKAVVLDCPGEGAGRKQQAGKPAKKAVLHFRILAGKEAGTNLQAGQISLADITIDTGRFHQIRAQMAHMGNPLLGDVKYGTEDSCLLSKHLQVKNVALCAYKLEFVHPVTGEKMHFQVKPEGDVFYLF